MKSLFWLASITALTLAASTSRILPAQEVRGEDETDVATHMHEHLARITTIKSYIIMGNLDGTREPAIWLAEHEPAAGLPENFQPYVVLMRAYAREVNNAPDLRSAAISVSRMAKICSNCHLANEVQIEFGYDQVPAQWSDTVSHMQRHQLVGRADRPIGNGMESWRRYAGRRAVASGRCNV
jgi:hypothetical protein